MEAEGRSAEVGSFGDAMACLGVPACGGRCFGTRGKPLLGICLGLQLLFGSSEGSPGVAGLGLLEAASCHIPPAKVLKFPTGMELPDPSRTRATCFAGWRRLLCLLRSSYYLHAADRSIVTGIDRIQRDHRRHRTGG